MATFLQAFDGTALTPALAEMSRHFATSPERVVLIIASYLVAGTAILPFSSWLVGRFTGRVILQLSLAMFGIASLGCVVAPGLDWMIAARIVQGIASGLMIPAARSVALHSVPANRTVRTIALLSSPVTLALIVGPLAGGLITTVWSWQAIFLINVPITLAMGAALWALMPPESRETDRLFDWRGAFLATLAITFLTVALAGYPNAFGASTSALLVGAGSLVGGWYLATWRRAAHPVLDLALFRNHSFRTVMIAGLFARSASRAAPLLIGLLLEIGLHQDPATAGVFLMATAVGSLGARPALTLFIRSSSFRGTLIWSTGLASVALSMMALIGATTAWLWVIVLMLAQGFLRSIQNVGLSSMAFAGVRREDYSHAIALTTISQQLSGNLGTGLALLCLTVAGRVLRFADGSLDYYAAGCVLLGTVSAMAVPFLIAIRPGTGDELVERKS